ncbi:ABC transporter ATP-binding protein [candidate division KSB1 bacterium]|nr:ABC transporter ATP-binding protein [candidate division KSB1 bacterium]
MNPIIEIKNLSFHIEGRAILDSVSFQIQSGDYISIIGPNGAGKSTLLKCLMRINTSWNGDIILNGQPLSRFSQRELAKKISYVPQTDGRLFPFTVEEFVLLGRYPYLSPFTTISPANREAVHAALELTQTTELGQRRLDTLSGGERQTVLIAAALAQGAPILLLDEPTTFLDPRHEIDIFRLLKKINQQYHRTIITVTHNINQAALQGQRVLILKAGQILFDGKSTEIMNNQILQQAYQKSFLFTHHPETNQLITVPEVN